MDLSVERCALLGNTTLKFVVREARLSVLYLVIDVIRSQSSNHHVDVRLRYRYTTTRQEHAVMNKLPSGAHMVITLTNSHTNDKTILISHGVTAQLGSLESSKSQSFCSDGTSVERKGLLFVWIQYRSYC